MDELERRLKQDAECIDIAVSAELDQRIRVSLENVTPDTRDDRRRERSRPEGFWWASSLTGVAAAVAVIAIINSRQEPPPPAATPVNVIASVPEIDWNAEAAMLTRQLEQELDALRSDIRKAEEKVKQEIGL